MKMGIESKKITKRLYGNNGSPARGGIFDRDCVLFRHDILKKDLQ